MEVRSRDKTFVCLHFINAPVEDYGHPAGFRLTDLFHIKYMTTRFIHNIKEKNQMTNSYVELEFFD